MFVKLDDTFWRDPKTHGLSTDAVALWTVAASWAGDYYHTEGLVPSSAFKLLAASLGWTTRKLLPTARELVKHDLWAVDPDGYRIKNWLLICKPAAMIDAYREREKERVRKVREGQRTHVRTSDPDPDPDPDLSSSVGLSSGPSLAPAGQASPNLLLPRVGSEDPVQQPEQVADDGTTATNPQADLAMDSLTGTTVPYETVQADAGRTVEVLALARKPVEQPVKRGPGRPRGIPYTDAEKAARSLALKASWARRRAEDPEGVAAHVAKLARNSNGYEKARQAKQTKTDARKKA